MGSAACAAYSPLAVFTARQSTLVATRCNCVIRAAFSRRSSRAVKHGAPTTNHHSFFFLFRFVRTLKMRKLVGRLIHSGRVGAYRRIL